METNLLDRMLNTFMTEQVPVAVTLQNKIRVSGRIRAFDSYVIVLDNAKLEIVYRHAVSCLAPAEDKDMKKTLSAKSPLPAKASPRQSRPTKTKPEHPAASTSAPEASINSGMKEGLLKWMQEQKAAK